MKKYFELTVVICVSVLLFNSCDIDNYLPTGQLTDKNVIIDEESANKFLNGIYNRTLPTIGELGNMTEGLSSAGTEFRYEDASTPNLVDFTENKVKTPKGKKGEDQILYRFYHASYKTLNSINIFIPKLEKGIKGISEKTKNQLLSEAKTLRANTHFMLLRVFGRFYDLNSEYGIVASAKFIDGSEKLKRNTVKEVYDLIISDLEFSIKHGTDKPFKYGKEESSNIYVTKTFSKALLAKVYLYIGGKENYQKTASLCQEIINNLGGRFSMESNYSEIFQNGFLSKEMIFAPHVTETNFYGNHFFKTQSNLPGAYLKKIADEQYGYPDDGSEDFTEGFDPRFSFTFGGGEEIGDRYRKHIKQSATFYYLRVAEIYLIYAEAVARADGNSQKAIKALNTVRKRAFANEADVDEFLKTYEPYDKVTFLKDVLKEKLLELHIENAEPWFDLVRYDRLGNLSANKIKPSIKSENQLIFPIPDKAIKSNPAFGKQNPGYN